MCAPASMRVCMRDIEKEVGHAALCDYILCCEVLGLFKVVASVSHPLNVLVYSSKLSKSEHMTVVIKKHYDPSMAH